jgi:hypothetical protein
VFVLDIGLNLGHDAMYGVQAVFGGREARFTREPQREAARTAR